MKSFNLDSWIASRKGKHTDIDGYYGAQCWDLFADYCIQRGIKTFDCVLTGYVIDIWNNRNNNQLLKYFDNATYDDMQKGDWIIFEKSLMYPYSHIAMVYDTNPLQIFGQNQLPTNQKACIIHAYDGPIACILRFKEGHKCKFKKSGSLKAIVDHVRVRTLPIIDKSTDTGAYYDSGMKFHYYDIVESNGYFWAVYTSYSGETRYVAIQEVGHDTNWFVEV